MKVDFNNLRDQTMQAHDELIALLNAGIQDGVLIIDAKAIKEVLGDLRMRIGAIGMCYEPGDPDMKNVYEIRYPGEMQMKVFNPCECGKEPDLKCHFCATELCRECMINTDPIPLCQTCYNNKYN